MLISSRQSDVLFDRIHRVYIRQDSGSFLTAPLSSRSTTLPGPFQLPIASDRGQLYESHQETSKHHRRLQAAMSRTESEDLARGSYERACVVDLDDRSADGETIVDELDLENLPLSAEELAFHDPLEKIADMNDAATSRSLWSSPGTPFLQRLFGLKTRLRTFENEDDSKVMEDKEEEKIPGLLNNEWSAPTRWAAAGQKTVSWAIWPLPSFLHRFFLAEQPPREVRRPTDYLDGLRGYASLFVFIGHYLVGLKADFLHHSFGADNNWSPFQLPFIRTVYSGSAMVAIFFVISGYVLSARCIVAMRAEKHEKLYAALTSMTFRRGIRLFLPSVAVSLIALVCVFLGLSKPRWMVAGDEWTAAAELQHYVLFLKNYVFRLWSFGAEQNFWYSQQLWTIPLEFRCSMILFVVILGVARCTTLIRFAILGVFQLYLWIDDRWDVALFVAGMTIAELNIIRDEKRQRVKEAELTLSDGCGLEKHRRRSVRRSCASFLRQILLWVALIVGFYLTGYPQLDSHHTPGYGFLARLWGSDPNDGYLNGSDSSDVEPVHDPQAENYYEFRFYLGIAAILVVASLSCLPRAQRFFTTGFARYLGKISYALYLVHIVLNNTLRNSIWRTFWTVMHYKFSEGDDEKFEGGVFLGTLLYVPCVIWAADVFWRAVDIPSVKFAKWVEDRCFKKTSKS